MVTKLVPIKFLTQFLVLTDMNNTVSFEIANTHFGLNHALPLLTETPDNLVDIKLNKGNAKDNIIIQSNSFLNFIFIITATLNLNFTMLQICSHL